MAVNKPLVIGLAVLAALIALNASGLVTKESLQKGLAQNKDMLMRMGLIGNLMLVFVDLIFIVFFFPGSFFLELFCGYAYGVPLGAATILIGKNMAAAVCFYAGRFALTDWVKAMVASNQGFKSFHKASGGSGWQLVLAARLSPVPSYICNYGFSVTNVSFRDYMLATVASSFPMVLQNVYIGSLAHEIEDIFSPKGSSDGLVKQLFKFGLPLIGTILIVLWTKSFLANISKTPKTKKEKAAVPPASSTRAPSGRSPKPRTKFPTSRSQSPASKSGRSKSPAKPKSTPVRGRSPAKKATPAKKGRSPAALARLK